MKKYEITLLTAAGLVTEIYTTTQPLEAFEAEMTRKYGQFITYQSKQLDAARDK